MVNILARMAFANMSCRATNFIEQLQPPTQALDSINTCYSVPTTATFRGPRTTHHPHKRPSLWGAIFGGVVCELSEPKKKAKYAPPPVLHLQCWSSILWGWRVDFAVWYFPFQHSKPLPASQISALAWPMVSDFWQKATRKAPQGWPGVQAIVKGWWHICVRGLPGHAWGASVVCKEANNKWSLPVSEKEVQLEQRSSSLVVNNNKTVL